MSSSVRLRVLGMVALAASVACAGSRDAPRESPAPAPRPIGETVAPAPAGPDVRRWIAGDLHMHVAPFDTREGAGLYVADIARLAPAAGLEFVIATPHVHPGTWGTPARRQTWLVRWTTMAAEARAATGVTIIPGVEWTVGGHGHFGVSGVDLAALDGDFLAAAHRAGALVVVNHPFAVPTRIPGIPISERDLSFRPWTERTSGAPHLDAVEVWNLPLALANIASRPGGLSGEERAFAAADALARRERRPVATVGGSDGHGRVLLPTTWVLAPDAREASILAALRAGAACVGGPEAGTLAARGDADPPDRRARIGDVVRARERVELTWDGRATLFIDGVSVGEHDGGFVHARAGGVHTYRIETAGSRCGFVYANLAR